MAHFGVYLHSKYTRIQNDEQLLRYKRDFDCEYPNYKKLYDYVENICRQFTELRESISGKEEESEEWNVSVLREDKVFSYYNGGLLLFQSSRN